MHSAQGMFFYYYSMPKKPAYQRIADDLVTRCKAHRQPVDIVKTLQALLAHKEVKSALIGTSIIICFACLFFLHNYRKQHRL